MKIFSGLTVALLMIFQAIGFAATETFSANGEYLMSDYDTPEIAEEIALDFAKQNAAEQAGIYLESYSLSIDAELEKDEIKTVASSKVEILEKNISRQPQVDGRILLHADIKAKVDTSDLDNFVKQTREQRQAAIQRYKSLQEMNAKIKQDIDDLQKKIAELKDGESDDKLIVEQERINREFLSTQKLKTVETMDFSNHSQKIEILDEVVKLNPRNGDAYAKLGEEIYLENSTLNAALQNFNRALTLEPKNAKHYMQRGGFYRLWLKDYLHAVEDYNQAIKLGGLDDEDMRVTEFWLCSIYVFELNDYSAGIKNFTQIINLCPNDAWGYFYRGVLYEKIKDSECAIEDYAKAAEIAPLNVRAHLELGHAYERANNTEKAIECFMAALDAAEQKFKNDPDDIQNFREYLSDLDRIPFGLIRDRKRDQYGETDNYLTRLDELIKRYPNAKILYETRGLEYNSVLKYDLALKDLDTAMKLATTIADKKRVHKFRTYVFKDMKNMDKVTAEYQSIIDLDPKDAAGYYDLYNWLNLFVKDKKKADEVLDRWIEIVPEDVTARLIRAERFSAKKDHARALEEFNSVINHFPDNVHAHISRARFHQQWKDFAAAIEDLDAAIKIDPKNPEIHSARAYCYIEMEDWIHAVEECTKAIKLHPKYGYYYYLRGRVYYRMGKYKKALADYDKSLELDSNNYFAKRDRQHLLDELKK